MSFKLQLVQEIERGQLTVTEAAKKYVFKIEQPMVQENLVTLIGKIKHHLLCQSHQNRR
jgi:hypothetical protein